MPTVAFWIQILLSIVNWTSITLVCIFFFWRRIYRLTPEFANYVVFLTATAWISNPFYYFFEINNPGSRLYFCLYLVCGLLMDGLELLAIYLILKRLLRSLPRSASRLVPRAAILSLIAIVVVIFHQSDWHVWKLMRRVDFIQLNLALLECTLVFCTISIAFLAALPWERTLKGLVAGFGLDSSLRLMVYAVSIGGHRYWITSPTGQIMMQAANTIAPVWWFMVVLRTPRNSPRKTIGDRRELETVSWDLKNLTSSLGSMIYRGPNNTRSAIRSVCLGVNTMIKRTGL